MPKKTEKTDQSVFSQNLNKLLKDRGISQRAAAELAGVNPSVVNDWCNGAVPRDLKAVSKLCKALSTDFEWILTGEASEQRKYDPKLEDFFEVEKDSSFSGIFQIEAKKLKRKK